MTKESAKRGYMTFGEIKEKLKSKVHHDEYTDAGSRRYESITYLEKILKKKNGMAPETRDNVYRMLDSLYAREVRLLKWQGLKARATGGDPFALDHASDYIDKRATIARERGDIKRAIRLYEQARRLNEKAEKLGAGSWTPVCGDKELAGLYEQARMFKKARALKMRIAA